ncbi:MAG TPA: T9SS type A sorting domain-containing protein [Bacteroidia bacterium]|jgi:hypothetical protein|nr:T9SS type A sorting domain-containing protein [Bacteroidia bacterium]
MKKLFFLLGYLVTGITIAQTNISNYTYYDAEPSIAVSPVNSQNLVAAWMKATGLNQITIATCFSNNGGTTWSSPSLMPHISSTFTHADVSLAYTASGNPYICYIDSKVAVDSGYVMVAGSTNNGQTWSAPVKVTSARESADMPVDRPWIAVDNSSGPFSGRMYVTSKSYYAAPGPHYIWLKSSSDGGNSWSPIKRLDDSIPADQITNSMGAICVGPDGTIFVTYASYHPALSAYARLICSRSVNGGTHFIPYPIANFAGNSAVSDTLYHAAYNIASDAAHPGNLIVSYIDARDGDPDVMAYHSSDTAHTWNASPVRVNDDAIGNGIGQDMCWAGFASNAYFVSWRDRRNGGTTSTSPFQIYWSMSQDNGATFCPNKCLSGTTSSPSIDLRRGNDFMGMATSPNSPDFWCDWSDMRTGNTEIFASGVTVPGGTCGTGIIEYLQHAIPVQTYPNPSHGQMMLHLCLPEQGEITISIFGLNGVLIQSFSKQLQQGAQVIPLDFTKLPAGAYLLKAFSAAGTGQIQFEKQ